MVYRDQAYYGLLCRSSEGNSNGDDMGDGNGNRNGSESSENNCNNNYDIAIKTFKESLKIKSEICDENHVNCAYSYQVRHVKSH
jgi:hypothetical protein